MTPTTAENAGYSPAQQRGVITHAHRLCLLGGYPAGHSKTIATAHRGTSAGAMQTPVRPVLRRLSPPAPTRGATGWHAYGQGVHDQCFTSTMSVEGISRNLIQKIRHAAEAAAAAHARLLICPQLL